MRQTQEWLTQVLITQEYQQKVASNIDCTRRHDTLREQKSQQEQRARQLRLRQRFLQAEESRQEQCMPQQREQQKQRKLQKAEDLLHEQCRTELRFRREFAATVQHITSEWKLKPEPPKAKLLFARPVRPLPALL
jgi:hypothetical protein